MGFDVGHYQNKREVVHEKLQALERESVEIMAQATTKSGLWVALRRFETGEKFIVLFLIERWGKGEYAVKSITESMGPFYYDVPLRFLTLVPTTNLEWRKGVLEFYRRKNYKYRENELCTVYQKPYRVVGKQKRSYLIRSIDTGKLYKSVPENMVPNDAKTSDIGEVL